MGIEQSRQRCTEDVDVRWTEDLQCPARLLDTKAPRAVVWGGIRGTLYLVKGEDVSAPRARSLSMYARRVVVDMRALIRRRVGLATTSRQCSAR